MTATNLNELTDQLAIASLVILGDGTQYGIGNGASDLASDYGLSHAARVYLNLVTATQDANLLQSLLGGAFAFNKAANPAVEVRAKLSPLLSALTQAARLQKISGVTDLDSLAAYFNTGLGGAYNALFAPPFADCYKLISGIALSAANVYAPPATAMGSKTVGGALTGATALDSTAYAGAGSLSGTVTSFAGTGGTVTVTASARSAAGAVVTGRTFTATISGNGTITFAPSIAGDLCVLVAAIALPGGMSAGTLALTAQVPAGRTYPAV